MVGPPARLSLGSLKRRRRRRKGDPKRGKKHNALPPSLPPSLRRRERLDRPRARPSAAPLAASRLLGGRLQIPRWNGSAVSSPQMKTVLERRQTWPSATRPRTRLDGREGNMSRESGLCPCQEIKPPPPPGETAFGDELPYRVAGAVTKSFVPAVRRGQLLPPPVPSPPPPPNIGLLFGETLNRPLRADVAAEMKVGRRRRSAPGLFACCFFPAKPPL